MADSDITGFFAGLSSAANAARPGQQTASAYILSTPQLGTALDLNTIVRSDREIINKVREQNQRGLALSVLSACIKVLPPLDELAATFAATPASVIIATDTTGLINILQTTMTYICSLGMSYQSTSLRSLKLQLQGDGGPTGPPPAPPVSRIIIFPNKLPDLLRDLHVSSSTFEWPQGAGPSTSAPALALLTRLASHVTMHGQLDHALGSWLVGETNPSPELRNLPRLALRAQSMWLAPLPDRDAIATEEGVVRGTRLPLLFDEIQPMSADLGFRPPFRELAATLRAGNMPIDLGSQRRSGSAALDDLLLAKDTGAKHPPPGVGGGGRGFA